MNCREWIRERIVPVVAMAGFATIIIGIGCVFVLPERLGYDWEANLKVGLAELIVEIIGIPIAIFTA